MNDDQFLAAVRNGTAAEFHHRGHLRLTWICLRRYGMESASDHVAESIQRFAAAHGQRAKYHETITRFWVLCVAHAMCRDPEADFDCLLRSEQHLLDKRLPWRHWSEAALASPSARSSWLAPDQVPLPFEVPTG